MKKIFLTLAITVMALCANAQKNQYFWYQGNLMMGNPIAQIDSVTFGEGEPVDTLHIMLPRTIIKTVHDTVQVATHDTLYITNYTCLPEGALPGEFSVSPTKKVRFSKGNLQYQASTDTWRFAENQWDYVGNASLGNVYENDVKCNNALISSTYSGWIDLFGYSTASTYYGVSNSTNNSNYSGMFVDWGTAMGDNWRTLTKTEWDYLLNGVQNRVHFAIIDGVNGLIILSDNFMSIQSNYDLLGSGSEPRSYTVSQWSQIEKVGALFLPANGYREGSYPRRTQSCGEYYANTYTTSYLADGMQFEFSTSYLADSNNNRYDGRGVRLVQDVEE